ncbi:MAG: hypothetical protein MI923_14485 [Phycisphaerales bacterium]|nr:hypothetical protein [Phycisphaerales bacterium]
MAHAVSLVVGHAQQTLRLSSATCSACCADLSYSCENVVVAETGHGEAYEEC